MHRIASPLSLALCAAALPAGMATCASLEPLKDLDGWKLLMPAGAFKPNDGRPGWSNPNSEAVIAASKLPALIDIDHGTQTRGDSKAAAWIEEMKPHGPNGETGIWGRIEGTPAGKAALAAKDYRFFSPTFLHDATRVVTKIIGGSLVNNPALDDIPALASTQEITLDELLMKLRKALGLADTATADDVLSAIATLNNNAVATAAAQQLLAAASGLALAAGTQLSTDQVAAICAKLKTPAATGDQAQQIATLSQKVTDLTERLNTALLSQNAKSAEDKVNEGIAAGKIAPALKDEMIALCKAEPAKFEAMLAKAPVIVVAGKLPGQPVAEGELTEDQLALCAQLNIKPEDYKKTLAAQKKDAA
jgi:phage I-like protein